MDGYQDYSNVFLTAPTGAGKSLCYQVPALLLPGITLVISPLISLMQDQVKALNNAGIRAAFINSSLSEAQIDKALALAAGGSYKLLYVAPERLESSAFRSFAAAAELSMITVDEAHCISQWGQDFRPSYLKILAFVDSLPRRPILSAFTATATRAVQEDIRCTLRLQDPTVLVTGFDRPNLYFQVEATRRKDDFVLQYLRDHPGESGIIYCATRKNVDKLQELLAEAGYPDGFSTTLWCSDTQVMRDSAVVIQEQLRQVGINAEVKTLESGQFQSETGNGAHDMFIMSKTSIDPDSMLRSMYHTEALGPSGNRCFWTTPEVDALIDEASTTTDTEHAMELYAEIQSKVAEAAPLVPMAVEHLNAGMQSNVKGFGLYPGKSHYINGTYFE